jgi:heterodisulfide reductase subunit A
MKETKVNLIRFNKIEVVKQGKGTVIKYDDGNGKKNVLPVDMIILAPAIVPKDDASQLAKILGLSVDEYGFFKEEDPYVSSVISSKPGIFIAGCVQGAKNIQESVSQANAAVGKVLSSK